MRVLLFFLLALSTSAGHHVAPMPPAVSPRDIAEVRAASAELATALATALLAIAAFASIYVPRRDERNRQRDAARASARLLRRTLETFRRVINQLVDDINSNAEALLHGLEVPFTQALSLEVWRAMPPTRLSNRVYRALVNAHTSMVLAAELQRLGDRISAQQEALKAYAQIDIAAQKLFFYIDTLDRGGMPRWYHPLRVLATIKMLFKPQQRLVLFNNMRVRYMLWRTRKLRREPPPSGMKTDEDSDIA